MPYTHVQRYRPAGCDCELLEAFDSAEPLATRTVTPMLLPPPGFEAVPAGRFCPAHLSVAGVIDPGDTRLEQACARVRPRLHVEGRALGDLHDLIAADGGTLTTSRGLIRLEWTGEGLARVLRVDLTALNLSPTKLNQIRAALATDKFSGLTREMTVEVIG